MILVILILVWISILILVILVHILIVLSRGLFLKIILWSILQRCLVSGLVLYSGGVGSKFTTLKYLNQIFEQAVAKVLKDILPELGEPSG